VQRLPLSEHTVTYATAVGWEKAQLRRAHHCRSDAGNGMVGTPPDAFAPGGFAHPTHSVAERRQLLYLALMALRVHLNTGDLFKVMQ
jgi:hypothetical protein